MFITEKYGSYRFSLAISTSICLYTAACGGDATGEHRRAGEREERDEHRCRFDDKPHPVRAGMHGSFQAWATPPGLLVVTNATATRTLGTGDGSSPTSYAKLHPGPGWTREQAASHQRARIYAAMIELVAERGYGAVTVRELVRFAGVSRALSTSTSPIRTSASCAPMV